jgi:hypothetical protein
MSIHRQAARRDLNEPVIVSALQDIGAEVYRLSQPCDLLVRFRGQLYLMEVDNPDAVGAKYRKRDKNQMLFLAQWCVPLVRCVDDAFRVIGATCA